MVTHLEGEFPEGIEEALIASKMKQFKGRHKLKTILRRVSTLSWKHGQMHVSRDNNPAFHTAVTDVLKKAADDPSHARKAAQAADKSILVKVLESIPDNMIGKRDRALFAVAWASGGRRRSEAIGMTIEQREAYDDASGGYYIFNLTHIKNRKNTDEPLRVKIGGMAKTFLDAWLDAANIKSGPIFRQLTKGGKTVKDSQISGTQFYRITKKRFLESGIPGVENFSPHSFRSGFATELGKRGGNVGDGMAMTGHKCLQTFMTYYQAGAAESNSASNMLDDD
ncbi:hypothetical protein MNBD_GAMMA09-401 [hydrothermal vent metagenome]|uniref:Tyr recombinase domain-containing protein n=1 Tax=hydrothermal vent metagenome TaxID=652676 RepID=A0A3B0XX51_9ZZZZ